MKKNSFRKSYVREHHQVNTSRGWVLFSRYRRGGALVVLLAGVVTSFFIQLVLANSLATRGGEIKRLEEKRQQMLFETKLLEEQMTELQAVRRIHAEARHRLGMQFDAQQFDYLQSQEYAFSE